MREIYGPSSKSSHPIRDKGGNLLTTQEDIKERWVEHFSELLNMTTDIDETVLDELSELPINESLDQPITEKEIDTALKNTKLGKSPGPDGILPEILVYGGLTLKRFLVTLFTIFWATEQLPTDLVNPNITILFKKGNRSICGNYRGISLLSTVGKVIADIILQRLKSVIETVYPESQHGYRLGRGTIDGIFAVRQLMEKSREQHRHLYIAFIDFTKAFDTVNRPLLFKILVKIGCPPKLVKLIELLYANVKAQLIIDGELSKLFDYNCGVKQGCKLAPTLYGIYAAILLWVAFKDIKHDHSILIRFRTNGNLFDIRRLKAKTKVFYHFLREAQYADDIALFSDTAIGLQNLLNAYNIASKRMGLTINANKTEIMCLGPDTDFLIDEVKLNNVDRFKYLGSLVSKDCTMKEELITRIQSTSTAFGRLKERVFDNHNLTVITKVNVYVQCLLPILLYGSETWTLYAHEVKQLRTIQQRHLRSIMNIKWDDFVSNEEVLKRAGSEDIEVLLAKNRLRWLGHVARMEDSRMVKMLMYGELADGDRTVGRPRLRFKDNCKSLLKVSGSLNTWTEFVADRTKWRQSIKTTCKKLDEIRISKYEKRKERRR